MELAEDPQIWYVLSASVLFALLIDLLGELLLRRLREAYDMMLKHQTMFDDFSKTFSQATLSKWQADVERWEADPFTSPDPFVEQEICESSQAVRDVSPVLTIR